jgi:outer membrane biosynthesis protein TonB
MYTILLAALAATSLVSGAPHVKGAACKRYKESVLEDYATYHFRYVALDCRAQHNTSFFDECCHPLRRNENLTEVRAPHCTPNETAIASASAHIANVTAPLPTVTAAGDDDHDGEDNQTEWQNADDGAAAAYSSKGGVVPTTTTPAAQDATPTPTPTPTPDNLDAHVWEQPQDQPQDQPQGEHHGEEQSPTPSSSSEQTPSPTSSEQPQETPSGDNNDGDNNQGDNNNQGSNGGGEIIKDGTATFYGQKDGSQSGIGACGDKHADTDLIVAVAAGFYGDMSAKSPYCGRQVRVWPAGDYAGQGQPVIATVADACPPCEYNCLDLSIGTWHAMGIPQEVGRVPIEFQFL